MSDEQPIDLDDLQRVAALARERFGDNWVADMVEIARSEIARLREERRWIPVTERLPKLKQHVLVFCQHVPGRGGSWVGMHVAYRRADGLWMEPAEPCDVSVVTHWQRLPPPPGEWEVEE